MTTFSLLARRSVRFVGVFVAVAVMAVSLHGVPTATAEPVKVRIGASSILPTVIFPMFYKKPELLKHYGKSYTVDLPVINSTSIQLQALAAKEIDLGFLAALSLGNAIQNAKLDLRVVSDLVQEGIEGRSINRWLALDSSGITKPEHLKGKNIGVLAYGTAVDLILRTYLKQHGLDPNRDVNIVEAAFPNQGPMMRAGKLDVAGLVIPFTVIEQAKGGVHTVFGGPDAMGRHQALITVARTEFLQQNRQVMNDFFEDWLNAWRWFIDPKNKQEVLQIASSMSKIPVDKLQWYGTTDDYYRDPAAMPHLPSLQRNVDTAFEMGFIKERLDVAKITDLSFLEEAKRRLGVK
ncbi:MAG: ABC transporter substrate-binding protein [Candidatus Tectomicrobia bacterium]|nr:ABC transporter substrate-binding protein [Candidatus Tectomicrobia bacterium]